MRKIISCLVMVLSFAQNYANTTFNVVTSERKNYGGQLQNYLGVIGHDSNYYYAISWETLPVIEKYTYQMEFVADNDVYFNRGFFENINLMDITYFHDSIYVFYYDGKVKSTEIYSRTINKKTLELNNDERLIAKIDHFKGFAPDLNLVRSRNYEKILILSKISSTWSTTIHLEMFVLEKGLNKQFNKKQMLDYNHQLPHDWQYIIDDAGNVHLIANIYEPTMLSHVFDVPGGENRYIVLSYPYNGGKGYSNEFFIKNKIIRTIKITDSNDGGFCLAGFYSENYKYGSNGAFFSKSSASTGELPQAMLKDFPIELLKKIMPEKKAKKQKELLQIKAHSLQQLQNGNYILTGQQELERTYDNKNDIIIFNFSPYGDILWDHVVNKKQSGNVFSSYKFINPKNTNDFYIIFNDHPKNGFEPTYSRKLKSFGFPGPYYIHIVHFDEFGNKNNHKVKETRRERPTPNPNRIYDTRNGELVLMARHYNRVQLIRLNLLQ